MKIPISKKKVILIGSSGSIGKGMLHRLLEEGFHVGATYNNTPLDLCDSVLNKYKDQLYTEKIDVTDPNSVEHGLKRLFSKLGNVDAFIYNSGICDDSLLGMMTIKNWNKVMDVNINGAFLATKIISNFMIQKRMGKILLVSSYKGITGSYGQSNYSASKAALIGFSKSVSRELGKFGITVNVLCPGFIPTNMNQESTSKIENALEESVLSRISNIEEFANFTLYLLSDYVLNVSGQVFHIDSRI